MEEIKILLLDDSPDDRALMRATLLEDPETAWSIHEAETAQQGLTLCASVQPDCIVLDYGLPGMDGLAFLKTLRAQFGELSFPVVMVTGSGGYVLAVNSLKAGAQDYISKEYLGTDMLERAIHTAIDAVAQRRAHAATLEALKQSEQKFRAIFNQAFEYVGLCSPDGTVLDANQSALEYGALSKKDVVGKKAWETRYFSHSPNAQAQLRAAFAHAATGELARLEVESQGAASFQTLDYSIKPIRNTKGEVVLLIAEARDITYRKQAEEELLASKERLKLAQSAAGLGAWDWDISAGTKVCSPHYFTLYGLPPSDTGPSRDQWLQRVLPEHRQRLAVELQNALDGVEEYRTEFPICLPDRSTRWLSGQAHVFRDENGSPLRMLGVNADITKAHDQKIVLERQAQIISQVHDAIITTDLAGNIVTWNPGAERLFGYSPKEAIGSHVRMMYFEEDRDTVKAAILDPVLETGNHRVELRNVRKDGSECWIDLSVALLKDGGGAPYGVVGYSQDITQRRRDKEALDAASDRLNKVNVELQRFTMTVSHDLQEPLRTITSFTQLLDKKYGPVLNADGKELLDFVSQASNRMSTLISDLLSYARVTHEEDAQQTEVDLQVVFNWCLSNLQQTLRETDADVQCAELPVIQGSFSHLSQLFQNLLGNAIRYRSSETPRIRITVQRNAATWKIGVHDNGVGIQPEYAETIFMPFKRLQASGKSGSGLGLAIARRVVEMHGGRIWVESQPGRGSSFYFTLQAEPESQSLQMAASNERAAHQN